MPRVVKQPMRRYRGVTLVELIATLVITAILASVVASFITYPIEGLVALSRRAALVDAAESSLRRMARDIRLALPNSVRVTNTATGFALEMLPIVDGGKYTTQGMGNRKVNLHGNADDNFDNLGCFQHISPGTYSNYRLVINNLGTTDTCPSECNDAYRSSTAISSGAGQPTQVITPLTVDGLTFTITITNYGASCSATTGGEQHIQFSANNKFNDTSPRNRFFIVEKPVTYLCDKNAGTLTRYADYPIQSNQPTTASTLNGLSGVTSSLMSDNVSACTISTTSSDVRNRSLVTLSLTLTRDGESIRLIHQAQLDNSR